MSVTVSKKRRTHFGRRFGFLRGRMAALSLIAMAPVLAWSGHAMAQAASPTGGRGAQLNTMSSEALNSGSEFFGMACYLAAALCFGFGVWALWQSRQPQNRESGRVAMGLAGLVLAGLFAAGGSWINKAAITTSNANTTNTRTAGTVAFGVGG